MREIFRFFLNIEPSHYSSHSSFARSYLLLSVQVAQSHRLFTSVLTCYKGFGMHSFDAVIYLEAEAGQEVDKQYLGCLEMTSSCLPTVFLQAARLWNRSHSHHLQAPDSHILWHCKLQSRRSKLRQRQHRMRSYDEQLLITQPRVLAHDHGFGGIKYSCEESTNDPQYIRIGGVHGTRPS